MFSERRRMRVDFFHARIQDAIQRMIQMRNDRMLARAKSKVAAGVASISVIHNVVTWLIIRKGMSCRSGQAVVAQVAVNKLRKGVLVCNKKTKAVIAHQLYVAGE